MKRFELRSVCNRLLAEIYESTGKKNIIKLGIDIQLPEHFCESPDALLCSIRSVCEFLSSRLINGIISIEITHQFSHGMRLSVHVQITGLGSSRTHVALKPELDAFVNRQSLKPTYKMSADEIKFEFSHHLRIAESGITESGLQFRNAKILLAEDNEINAMVFTSFLEEWGAESKVVNNGLEAVTQIQENLLDVNAILMDIYMPMLNGIQATRKIREFNATIPIIAMTASTRDEDIREAIEAGANDYVLKPVSSTHLFQILSKYL